MRRLLALVCLLTAGLLVPGADAREPRDPSWPFDWAQKRVRMPEVWDHTTGNPSVVIASVDTGVNTTIPDLAGALLPGWDFTDGDTALEDAHGHGTLVASLMVGRGDNGNSIAGYCWQCRLLPVRVGTSQQTEDGLIAAGIRWAVDHGARVINVGFVQETGAPPDATVGEAIRYAVARGALIVASAGNTGTADPTYPGAYPGVLAVAATDNRDRLYDWSTRGAWVPLAAPGCQLVISLYDTWGELCGSSFTAPVVAGIAALALSLKPDLSAEQLRHALVSTAVPVAGIGGGRVDALAALRAAGAIAPAKPPPPPPPPPPPAASTGAGKAKPAPARLRRVVRGQLRRRVSVSFQGGTGKLSVSLSLSSTKGCDLRVNSASEVLLPTARRRDVLAITARVPAGRYVVAASCRSPKPQRYRLVISAPRATTDGAGAKGG